MWNECHQKSYQQIHQDESHDNQENNENKPCYSRNAPALVKNIVKIELSDHHNSCFHDRTGWILKRRLEKKKQTDRQEIILQSNDLLLCYMKSLIAWYDHTASMQAS